MLFDEIKQQVGLLAEIEKDLRVVFRQLGDGNWWVIDDTKYEESCPFCGHHDCFRIFHSEADFSNSSYKCFSCSAHGDVIGWRAARKSIEPLEAAKELAQEHGISVHVKANPVQQAMDLAALYYHNCLKETCNYPHNDLKGLTPLEYQLQIRKRKLEVLERFKVGYSDGNLTDYLDALGIDEETVIASGLGARDSRGRLRDYLPKNCFVYPHYAKRKASHFTVKDPTKRNQYQLKKEFTLNNCLFYGQDSFEKAEIIVLVEGENDLLAVAADEKPPACLATIGSLSVRQVDWLKGQGKDKYIITIFDPDKAGDGYRRKMERQRSYFKGMVHVLPPNNKDVDELLIEGYLLKDLVKNHQIKVWLDPNNPFEEVGLDFDAKPEAAQIIDVPSTPVAKPPVAPTTSIVLTDLPKPAKVAKNANPEKIPDQDISVVEEGGRYHRIVYKDQIPHKFPISDFVLKLVNVYTREGADRTREVVIRKTSGYLSAPFIVDSETKVSLKAFKVLMAKIADAEWMGKEHELDHMWRIVYSQHVDRVIEVPLHAGKHRASGGWLYRNVYVTKTGETLLPDDNGVFWLNKQYGLKPKSPEADVAQGSGEGLPELDMSLTAEETEVLLGQVFHHLTATLKSPGKALLALGWLYSNVHSDLIFKQNRGMSYFMFWGMYGGGKTTLVSWLRYILGMPDTIGRTIVAKMKSPVGFLRMAEYYCSVPLFLDELRNDEESKALLPMIRAWYDREGRTMGTTKDSHSFKTQRVNSTLMVAGEDLPGDPATRERCVSVRVPKTETVTVVSSTYRWFNEHLTRLSNIGYRWIVESCSESEEEIIKGMDSIDKNLRLAGCSSRISKNWSAAGYFGDRIARKFCPDFNFIEYLALESKEEQNEQSQSNTLNHFLQLVEIAANKKDNPLVNDTNFTRGTGPLKDPTKEGPVLHLWFGGIFDAIESQRKVGFSWSRHAILNMLKEQDYYISNNKKVTMGGNGRRQVAVTLDLEKCPDSLKNLAKVNDPPKIETPVAYTSD